MFSSKITISHSRITIFPSTITNFHCKITILPSPLSLVKSPLPTSKTIIFPKVILVVGFNPSGGWDDYSQYTEKWKKCSKPPTSNSNIRISPPPPLPFHVMSPPDSPVARDSPHVAAWPSPPCGGPVEHQDGSRPRWGSWERWEKMEDLASGKQPHHYAKIHHFLDG